jgi:hypothetical protein
MDAPEHDTTLSRTRTFEDESGKHTVWEDQDGEIAHVTVSHEYPATIHFSIREDRIPFYEDDNIDALDELCRMSLYAHVHRISEDGYVTGSVRCSHNANLGPPSFITTLEGWVN